MICPTHGQDLSICLSYVKWVHCRHGIVHPRDADRDGFQIWRVKLNKVVPLHATKALGGRGGISPTHS
jgi:hypothetical protein